VFVNVFFNHSITEKGRRKANGKIEDGMRAAVALRAAVIYTVPRRAAQTGGGRPKLSKLSTEAKGRFGYGKEFGAGALQYPVEGKGAVRPH
jgi:hypothetical protein